MWNTIYFLAWLYPREKEVVRVTLDTGVSVRGWIFLAKLKLFLRLTLIVNQVELRLALNALVFFSFVNSAKLNRTFDADSVRQVIVKARFASGTGELDGVGVWELIGLTVLYFCKTPKAIGGWDVTSKTLLTLFKVIGQSFTEIYSWKIRSFGTQIFCR